jgi:GrpB-like predicted nucleotidyltransferase (UPF0157 family)/predicted transcriptional regulator YdeE
VTSTQENTNLLLVGGQQVLAANDNFEETLGFYGDLFRRLTREVEHTGDRTRYVGYRSAMTRTEHLHFIGIEVDRIEEIPRGMVAWELDDNRWTVWETRNGQDLVVMQEDISWQWLDRPPSGRGRTTGEFSACLPAKLDGNALPAANAFWISANAYVGLQRTDADSDEVHLADYDPAWPQQFDQMASWLRAHLGSELVTRVEHYGSTSIPGMPAKPVIDVLVEIPSFSAAKRRAVPQLNEETWEYWWYSGHMTFIKRRRLQGKRTHHIHMAPRGHPVWEGLVFRDYLRSHPDEASRYAALKRELATELREDRERYTQAKAEFVREVIAKASVGRS